ncbi:DUF4436 family protein [Mycolicibacterium sp.]|uniref:DUF4436 family protein n=1 Tax=Mycolicibacterium sp. TaxID=2320850 RepID=UPI0028B17044|nr:DUF4436 family protein [Mycolicibacterium sp.]
MVTKDSAPVDYAASHARALRRRKLKWLFVALVALTIIASFVFFILSSFLKTKQSSLVVGDPNLAEGVRVTANVVDVAPADKVVRMRLAFQPVGGLSEDGNALSRPIEVVVIGGADVIHDDYKASEIILPADVRMPLRSGRIAMYPLDRYESNLRLEVRNADGSPIPSSLSVDASTPGYIVGLTSEFLSADGAVRDLTLRVSRAPTTLFFAIFTSALMLTLTTIVVLTVFWLLRGGASESVRFMIPLILVLLFAFPAMRSFVPGVPPLGVLLDFFAFFWCEIILGVAVVVVYANLMREMRKTAKEKEEQKAEKDEEKEEEEAAA